MDENTPKKVAVLYSKLSGFTLACLRALRDRHDIELLVFYWLPNREIAPYDLEKMLDIKRSYIREDYKSNEIINKLEEFSPDAICMSGWMDKGYLRAGRYFKERGVPVIAFVDNQWKGTLKQWGGVIISPYFLHRSIDILWPAGERQAQLSRRLGYRGNKMWYGFLSCDWHKFALIGEKRRKGKKKSFLYTGRYVESKGLKNLVQAYSIYRSEVDDPWVLHCAGSGPLNHILQNVEGIVNYGFVQPDEIAELFRSSGAFVLPSLREPWGVVIHEATASGLPVICAESAGAGVHLVQDGYNGFRYDTYNIDELVKCMIRMSSLTQEHLDEMGERSRELSKQFTPERWSDTLVNGVKEFYQNNSGY